MITPLKRGPSKPQKIAPNDPDKVVIEKMKNNRYLKPKGIIKGKKVQVTELAEFSCENAYFMYENLEDLSCTIT